ncbi:MAG: WYL domain-containing protein [Bacteroidales bacterium]|nr:WYL domain-containing protein [Bacteroidales bacterium]
MVTELLQKYIWLVQTFIRAGRHGLSLNEISDRWEDRFGGDYPRRTFNNHRDAVEEVFGIRIECDRSTNRYFIGSAEDLTDENAETAWLINTFTVNNMLTLAKERLQGRISVEDIPSGQRHLTSIMEAMTEGRELHISYKKYTSEEASSYTLRPYAVKEVAKRWYIIAYCVEREGLRVYGLDRITTLKVTDRKFRMPDGFDVDEVFATSFGIYLPEGPGQTITFRTSRTEARYLRDLPLHHSQKEVMSDGNSVTFSIFAHPNKALVMEICKHGSALEVLSPEGVRNDVATELRKASEIYNY